jgi:hypothetical protein
MRKSFLFPLVLVGTATVGCSSSSSGGSSPADSGPPKETGAADSSTADGGAKDAAKDVANSADAGADAAGDAADAAAPPPTPTGTTIETGVNFVIQGVTDDGYVIYTTSTAVKAAPVAGGAAVTILDGGDSGAAPPTLVSHNDVFVWGNVDPNTGIGTLSLWTHASPTLQQLSTTSTAFIAAASSDSTAIVYSGGTSSDGSTGALFGVTTSTLASPVSIATGVDVSGQNGCNPILRFEGTGSSAVAVASYCVPLPPDAGAAVDGGPADAPPNLYAYPVSSWAPKTLGTNISVFAIDTAATAAAVGLASGQLQIAPVAGTTPLAIDATGTLASSPSVYLAKNDAFVLYATAGGALKSSVTTASSPTPLVATGVNGLDAVSPNETFALVHNGTDSNTGLPSDLSLASVTAAGTPTTVTSGTTVAGILGDPFTVDGSYAIFSSALTVDTNFNAVGNLTAVSTASPGTPIALATATVNSAAFSPTDLALSGTKLSFTDNFNASNGSTGSVDLKVIDLAGTAAAKVVMSGADPLYFVSFDKKYILYTITFGGSTDGIYSVAVP